MILAKGVALASPAAAESREITSSKVNTQIMNHIIWQWTVDTKAKQAILDLVTSIGFAEVGFTGNKLASTIYLRR